MGNLNKGSLLKAALWGGVALCTPMASTAAWATDVDAGDYVALPPGSNLAIVYAQFAERDAIYAKGDKQPGDPGFGLDRIHSARRSLYGHCRPDGRPAVSASARSAGREGRYARFG
ncbi:hypothetical protein [Sphingobium yanoikuyae]|uniref:hypothetical protein n=1 Tax=Sphingobium yanoikuyae TaxID=13690 RepID=UPI001F41156C|nr:hypothetical protein [Sphingobium yanoikuyae]